MIRELLERTDLVHKNETVEVPQLLAYPSVPSQEEAMNSVHSNRGAIVTVDGQDVGVVGQEVFVRDQDNPGHPPWSGVLVGATESGMVIVLDSRMDYEVKEIPPIQLAPTNECIMYSIKEGNFIREAEAKNFLMQSEIKQEPEGSGTKPWNIVLWMLNGQYVTHQHTPDNNSTFSGHYHGTDYGAAVKEFLERCEEWGLKVVAPGEANESVTNESTLVRKFIMERALSREARDVLDTFLDDSDGTKQYYSMQFADMKGDEFYAFVLNNALDYYRGDAEESPSAEESYLILQREKEALPKNESVNEEKYVVNVGNIGNITCKDKAEAEETYKEYVEQSKSGKGRAGGESVYLMVDGEPEKEYFGTNTDESIKEKYEPFSGTEEELKDFVKNTPLTIHYPGTTGMIVGVEKDSVFAIENQYGKKNVIAMLDALEDRYKHLLDDAPMVTTYETK